MIKGIMCCIWVARKSLKEPWWLLIGKKLKLSTYNFQLKDIQLQSYIPLLPQVCSIIEMHSTVKKIEKISTKGKTTKVQSNDHNLFEGCIFGKQRWVSLSIMERESMAKELELVHTNMWGLVLMFSFGGFKYLCNVYR